MNKSECAMLGVVLVEYRDAVQMIDGCLVAATDISKYVDPEKAATIAACRIAILQALDVAEGLLADRRRKES